MSLQSCMFKQPCQTTWASAGVSASKKTSRRRLEVWSPGRYTSSSSWEGRVRLRDLWRLIKTLCPAGDCFREGQCSRRVSRSLFWRRSCLVDDSVEVRDDWVWGETARCRERPRRVLLSSVRRELALALGWLRSLRRPRESSRSSGACITAAGSRDSTAGSEIMGDMIPALGHKVLTMVDWVARRQERAVILSPRLRWACSNVETEERSCEGGVASVRTRSRIVWMDGTSS
jgi:hypothetical protein